jgi:hypothetical protein
MNERVTTTTRLLKAIDSFLGLIVNLEEFVEFGDDKNFVDLLVDIG